MPKKRGPKTDVLEALLKRVDGLEAKLKEKKDQPGPSATDATPVITSSANAASAGSTSPTASIPQDPSVSKKTASSESVELKSQSVPPAIDTSRSIEAMESAVYTPSPSRCANFLWGRGDEVHFSTDLANASTLHSAPSPSVVQTDTLLDTYFSRFHAKPFYILDESNVRQRLQLGQLPNYLVNAIYAVAARFVRQ